jgi:hypothetical protein|tara:strand:+ start:2368 stop:3036 length:669 start_codon:yes stop_codon:yes gene_type:complete
MNEKTEKLFERLKEKNCSYTNELMKVEESVKRALEGRDALIYFNLCNEHERNVEDQILYNEGSAENNLLVYGFKSSESEEKREPQHLGVSEELCLKYLQEAKEIEEQNHAKYDQLIDQLRINSSTSINSKDFLPSNALFTDNRPISEAPKGHGLENILNTPRNIRDKFSKREVLTDYFGKEPIENLSENFKEDYEEFIHDDSDILYKHLLRNVRKLKNYLEV